MTKKQLRRASSQYRTEVREALDWCIKHDHPFREFYAQLLADLPTPRAEQYAPPQFTNRIRKAA